MPQHQQFYRTILTVCFLLLTVIAHGQTHSDPSHPKIYVWSNSQYRAYDITSDTFLMKYGGDSVLIADKDSIDVHSVQLITFDCPMVIAERSDLAYFSCIDSIRAQMLFIGGFTKQSIVGITDMHSQPRMLYDLPSIDADFTGTLEYIKVLNDGNYLLYETRPDECDRIWKLWPDTQQLVPVFTFRNKYQSLKYHWGLEYVPDSHTLYMSEYGNSLSNPQDPEDPKKELGYKAGATKIWCSTDEGETWHQFVDFRQFKTIFYERFHIHAIHYDRYDHRLYVSSGDAVQGKRSNKRLWWTDDGKKWNSVDWSYYWGTTNDAFSHGQIVSFYADKDFIVAGGDDYNNCLYRIKKRALFSTLPLLPTFHYQPSSKGTITQYTTQFKKLSNGLITTFLTGGDADGFPRCTRLMGTYDGINWFELYRGSLEDGTIPLFQAGNFEEWNHHLYFGINEIVDGKKVSKFIEMNIPRL